MLFFVTFSALAFGLISPLAPVTPSSACAAGPVPGPRVVYLARELSDECFLTLSSAVAGAGKGGVVLLDCEKLTPYTKAFLADFKPERIVPVGSFPNGLAALNRRLGVKATTPISWTRGPAIDLWQSLFPRASQVVVCPAEPRGQLLQSACLAGTLRAPLFVLHGHLGETARLRELMIGWETKTVHLVGAARKLASSLTDRDLVKLADAEAVASARLRVLTRQGSIETIIVANPEDTGEGMGRMSVLAPWLAVQKRAALLLTNKEGKNVDEVVKCGLRHPALREADALLLIANLQAIPVVQRPNPIPTDKDPIIEMEPLTPRGNDPFSFATGRLFHEEVGVIPLLVARQRLLAETEGPRRALVVSNPGDSLPLLETFSRNTAQELRNAGYQTTALFGKDVVCDKVRKLMAEHDLFLWEGHHNTLIKDFDMPSWTEPMPPSLVFLQSCLALKDYKVAPLLSRGAVGVVGSSTRTYSGSGGACSLAFFNALLYEEQSLGGSLRQAKNFLLAYSLLKEKRLGKEAKRTGANLRSAWAFTLWGDPTLKLPRPEAPESAHSSVSHEVAGNTIILGLPSEKNDPVSNGKFKVQMAANGRLAGLVRKTKDEDGQPLVPFVFAEVRLPKGHKGQTPVLSSKLPSTHWVFCWDDRRRCGYLLATPRPRDDKELRFRIHWQSATADGRTEHPEGVGSGQ
jgi:hypothetical protein